MLSYNHPLDIPPSPRFRSTCSSATYYERLVTINLIPLLQIYFSQASANDLLVMRHGFFLGGLIIVKLNMKTVIDSEIRKTLMYYMSIVTHFTMIIKSHGTSK